MRKNDLVIGILVFLCFFNFWILPCVRTQANDHEFVLREIGHIPTAGRTDCVHAGENILYTLDFELGFLIYDVSDPTNSTLLGSYEGFNSINPSVKGGHSFFVRGDHAIVGFQHAGLKIIDVSDPANLAVVGTYYGGTDTYNLAVVDDLVYLAMEYDGLQIVDISDVTQPTKVGEFINGNPLYYIAVCGNYVFTKDNEQDKTLWLNVTNPSNITEIGQFDWVAIDLEMTGKISYIGAFSEGVLTYDFSDPTNPLSLSQHNDGGNACDIDIIGNLAFVADGADGLEILNITDSANPVEVAQFTDGEFSVNVFVKDNIAYIAERENGVVILELWEEDDVSQVSAFNQYLVLIGLFAVLVIRKRKKRVFRGI
ncbi:MAG: LVIVD repeat-containing protein [Candidatus Hodarchaeota archaeon]